MSRSAPTPLAASGSSPEVELLFVFLGGAILGMSLRYLLRGREAHGALLLPAIGAATASVVWAALTWLGWSFDGGWIWVVSFAIAGIAVLGTGIVLPRRRRAADTLLLDRLSRGA